MSESTRALAARRELLLARSRLRRLELLHESEMLRRSLVRPSTIFSIARSSPVRPLVFSALLMVAGQGRLAKIIRVASSLVAIATLLVRLQEPRTSSASEPPVSTRTRS